MKYNKIDNSMYGVLKRKYVTQKKKKFLCYVK